MSITDEQLRKLAIDLIHDAIVDIPKDRSSMYEYFEELEDVSTEELKDTYKRFVQVLNSIDCH